MHSTPVRGSRDTCHLPFVDRLDEQLQIFERRRGGDAVTQVEDVTWPAACATQHIASTGSDQFGRPEEHRRVQVALDASVEADHPPADVQRYAPIERDDIRSGGSDWSKQADGVGPEV